MVRVLHMEGVLMLLLVALLGWLGWWLVRSFGRPGQARRQRIREEDALKHLFHSDYRKQSATIESLAGALSVNRREAAQLGARLQSAGLARVVEEGFELTDGGRRHALHIIRAHRLFETHLALETGLAEEDWHQRAESAEHRLSNEEVNALADRLGRPRFDPHGDPIPTRSGTMPESRGISLIDWPVGVEARIVHIEDEPESIYAELVHSGLAAGMNLRVMEEGRDGFLIRVEGREIHLSIPMVVCLTVEEIPEEDLLPESVVPLTTLPAGRQSIVYGLSPGCLGAERRRLLDLGVVPGTVITRELESPFGSPSAFRIRGTLVALRRRQTDRVLIDGSRNPHED